jgi:hypothetical protein
MVEERFVRTIPIQAKLFWPEVISKSNFDAEWSQWFKLWLFVGGRRREGDPEWVNKNLLFSSQENKGGLQRIRIF